MPEMTTPKSDSVFAVLLLGLKTWVGEMKFLASSVSGRFEISRLRKELNKEYEQLGRIAESPRGKKDIKEACLQQIGFLKEEIETLKEELEQARQARMAKLSDENI